MANRGAPGSGGGPLDTVAVKTFDSKGKVTGERLFAGLFTSMAYSRSPSIIPLLRQKVDAVMKLSGFSLRSHDGKALLHILENYPRDELFQISVEDLHQIAVGVLHLQERQRTALRSEEHTSELQSLMRISYAVFCLKKKNHTHKNTNT